MKSITYKFTINGTTQEELISGAEKEIDSFATKPQSHYVYEMVVEKEKDSYTAQVVARIRE